MRLVRQIGATLASSRTTEGVFVSPNGSNSPGFFLLHRSVFACSELEMGREWSTFEAWIYLLSVAGWDAGNAGQITCQLSELQRTFRWSRKRIRIVFDGWENAGMITRKTIKGRGAKLSLTLSNYTTYQKREAPGNVTGANLGPINSKNGANLGPIQGPIKTVTTQGLTSHEGPIQGPIQGQLKSVTGANLGPISICIRNKQQQQEVLRTSKTNNKQAAAHPLPDRPRAVPEAPAAQQQMLAWAAPILANGDRANPVDHGEAVAMVFACRGGQSWALTDAHLAALQDAFPLVDCRGEARKALSWAASNAARQKTPKGMPRFLNAWMGRVERLNTERPSLPSSPSQRSYHKPTNQEIIDDLLARRRAGAERGLHAVE